jgi:hypothetical protein
MNTWTHEVVISDVRHNMYVSEEDFIITGTGKKISRYEGTIPVEIIYEEKFLYNDTTGEYKITDGRFEVSFAGVEGSEEDIIDFFNYEKLKHIDYNYHLFKSNKWIFS